MPFSDADAIAVITAAFPDARQITDADTCPSCGRHTRPSPAGRRCLCRRCTLRDIGCSELTLALAVEFGKSIKVIEARLERFGPPSVSPKEWITPRSRLR